MAPHGPRANSSGDIFVVDVGNMSTTGKVVRVDPVHRRSSLLPGAADTAAERAPVARHPTAVAASARELQLSTRRGRRRVQVGVDVRDGERVGGHLGSHFVAGPRDLERRLADLDIARDPDGRFRINDFFCFDTTWKDTLDALLTRVDVVLMDLRGLSESNRGCLFELTKLVERGKLQETLFVLDDATDERIFNDTLATAATASPRAPQFTPQLARVGQPSLKQLRAVYSQLLAVGVNSR